jgi:riboflavin kinase / FMN adenylyltransferase
MKLLDPAGAALSTGTVVSIGMFDGVHRGHRSVLSTLRERARVLGLPTVVLTFDPHPRRVLQPASAPRMLSRLSDRLALLAASGMVDHCLVLPFDLLRSQEPVDTFVHETLLGQLRMRALVVGKNFACGRARRGDISYLQSVGSLRGFEVHPVALQQAALSGVGSCSSTLARRLIEAGDVGSAALILDRPHQLTGAVAAVSTAPEPMMDVLLPEGLCTPPEGHYFAAVQAHSGDAAWTPTKVSVREDTVSRRRCVRVPGIAVAACGEMVGIRFYRQTSPARSRRWDNAVTSADGNFRTSPYMAAPR